VVARSFWIEPAPLRGARQIWSACGAATLCNLDAGLHELPRFIVKDGETYNRAELVSLSCSQDVETCVVTQEQQRSHDSVNVSFLRVRNGVRVRASHIASVP
jgi:hypothetical protein